MRESRVCKSKTMLRLHLDSLTCEYILWHYVIILCDRKRSKDNITNINKITGMGTIPKLPKNTFELFGRF